MTSSFASKLDELTATAEIFFEFDAASIASSLADGRDRHAIAVGSGGSAASAAYFARCRQTLGLGPTSVETPTAIVLGASSLSTSNVWLFSAGADNADARAAAMAASQRCSPRIDVVTRGSDGSAAQMALVRGGQVHRVPVASESDGYLATHSMVSTSIALSLASDMLAHDAYGSEKIVETICRQIANMRTSSVRTELVDRFSSLRSTDSVILLADPLLAPIASMLETSLWEASLCPVQVADFRNFAHGRHSWLHHRPDETHLIALTTLDSHGLWNAIDLALPRPIRRCRFDFQDGGRLANALGLVDALGIVEAIGEVLNIDPAKPGYGQFGPLLYDDNALEQVAVGLPGSVRHKRSAMYRMDERSTHPASLRDAAKKTLSHLRSIRIAGVVLDYDGTIVSTADRFSPAASPIVEQLERLDAGGIAIGIATGRGHSAGEGLRAVLPVEMHSRVVVGYYNGSHVVPLTVDIERDPPPPDPVIGEMAAWLIKRSDLFSSTDYKVGKVQITINTSLVRDPMRFGRELESCSLVSDGQVRVQKSGHSFDIVSGKVSKLKVLAEVRSKIKDGLEVLCFGDSGAFGGNDAELLGHPTGISVGDVDGTMDGCISLFDGRLSGPEALLRVLSALVVYDDNGTSRLDIDSLNLDILE
ncbi:HAD family hydrolase [uncultured Erythrobacter sp.]|uniref:HAD family hydrolase n=1 Tax=uncultured Erythrobacter sp. TaxID=263913 RepID=UPI0026276AD4|nr:HAD hydrolase family protein [uncultured Erythrobacter sp.]